MDKKEVPMLRPANKILLVLVSIIMISTTCVKAAGRYALVIGNSAYTGSPPLKNPKNDAELIAKTLTEVGFEVIKVTDADQRQMRRAMLDFSRVLRNNENSIGLFYYAGHGVQVRGINYIVPVTADIKDEEEVRFEGVDVNDFLGTMRSSKSRLNIIILDACRNNPYAGSNRSGTRGLAPVQAASGTLIAYSTAPGDVAFDGNGLNSPYTLALSRFIRKPGLAVETVFKRVLASVEDATEQKQTPWLTGAFRGEFFFKSKEKALAAQQVTIDDKTAGNSAQRSSSSVPALEKLFWESIVNSSNAASFKAYLTAFPTGVFAPLAKLKIAELATANKPKSDKNIIVAANPPATTARAAGAKPSTAQPVNPPVKKPNILTYRAIFPDSSRKSLKRAEVEGLTCHKLWIARNEIFHRNGYCFKSEKGIRYFDNSNCTSAAPRLSSLEQRNKRTIRTWEIRKRCSVKRKSSAAKSR
ncbi:MAG: YARHG domain-containing protein [bacterium]|nr:YARHG domain-containing protein [bacterium]